jgi:hypothetical protein
MDIDSSAIALPAPPWKPWAAGAAIGLAALLLLVISICAYLYIFHGFAANDDEGYMMITVRHLLGGRALYDRVPTVYGPFYYFFEWLLHRLLRVPLTNDATRIVSMTLWIATSVILAVCALKMTRRASLAALVYTITFFYLRIVVETPGHPQELCGLLMALGVAVCLWVGHQRRTVVPAGLGAVAAALVLTKLNVGVLAALAVLLALTAAGRDRLHAALGALAAAAAMLLPFVIARAYLNTVWGLCFALLISLSVVPLWIVSRTAAEDATEFDLASCATSFVVVAAAALSFAFAHHATLAGLIDGIFLMPQRVTLPGGPSVPVSPLAVAWSLLSIVLAAVHVRQGPLANASAHATAFHATKMLFGVWVLSRAWVWEPISLVNFGTPFLWLGLAPRWAGAPSPARSAFPRLVLCSVATLQPFQVYPVPGSQSHFGTFLMILVAAVCVGDAWSWAEQVHGGRMAVKLLRRAGLPLVLVLVAALCFRRGTVALANYRAATPLGMRGAERIRVRPRQAARYRWLVASLEEHADTFLCTTGFNSLHFWTGMDPPSPIAIGNNLDIFTRKQQQDLVDSLARFPNACVVFHPNFFTMSPPAHASKNLLLEYIDAEFITYDRADGFELKFRKGRSIAPLPVRNLARGAGHQHGGGAGLVSQQPSLDER